MLDALIYIFIDQIAYFTGRVTCILLFPFFRIRNRGNVRSNPYAWRTFGFYYVDGERRYLYRETVESIGVATWFVAIFVLWVTR